MLIKAVQKNTRQAPRKVRLIANTVKKLPLSQAIKQLSVIERKSTIVVGKVLRQAVADAMNNHGYQFQDLEIESITVNEGPRYRRFQAVSRGRAHGIMKRTSHITVVLRTTDEKKTEGKSASKSVATEKVAPVAQVADQTAAPAVKAQSKKTEAKKSEPKAKKPAANKEIQAKKGVKKESK